ncbi:hypothetical protein DFO54_107161 [Erwinia sp. AG740]|nr:hypothetical protein C1O30_09375 [Dickeya zeae]PXW45124.1 hypothetical protein DFO54_107161 [Erwinia sp. AG740]
MRFGFWHGAWLSLFISYDILWTALAVSIDCYLTRYYPSYFKLQVCWLRSFTRITYLSKLIGVHSLAALQGSNEPCPKGPTRSVVQHASVLSCNSNYFGYTHPISGRRCMM